MKRALLVFTTVLFACGGSVSPSAAPAPSPSPAKRRHASVDTAQMGVNLGTLTDDSRVAATIAFVQTLGARWVRLELDHSQSADYWSSVVDRLRAANIQVLGVLSNVSWSGGAIDGDLQNVTPCPDGSGALCGDPLADPGCSSAPGPFGTNTLVPQFIAATDPVVQRLKDRVSAWEIWNEANNGKTALCAGNYAQLLAQARVSWPDIGIRGPSILSIGSSDNAQNNSAQYLSALYGSDPVQALLNAGGSVPWDRVMLHPYPDEPGDEDPTQFLPSVVNSVSFVGTPLWFTETGYQGSDAATWLPKLFDAAAGLAEHTFWFALYNCVPDYGLLDSCWPDSTQPLPNPRATFDAFIAEGRAATSCTPAAIDYAFPVAGCANVAPYAKSYSASGTWTGQPGLGGPDAAGGVCSVGWNSGYYAPQWWQADFGAPRPIRGVSLVPGMLPDANVVHVVEVSDDGASYRTVLTISQFMANGQVYPFDFGQTVRARFLRLRSVSSPSWISWTKVAIFDCY